MRIELTGASGIGKSTILDQILKHDLQSNNLNIGVGSELEEALKKKKSDLGLEEVKKK